MFSFTNPLLGTLATFLEADEKSRTANRFHGRFFLCSVSKAIFGHENPTVDLSAFLFTYHDDDRVGAEKLSSKVFFRKVAHSEFILYRVFLVYLSTTIALPFKRMTRSQPVLSCFC